MNYDAFSHGQIKSKIWLAEQLEPHLKDKHNVVVLGSWYNITAFILKCRGNTQKIVGVDLDKESTMIADRINDYWKIEDMSIDNIVGDCTTINLEYDTVINSSSEHMTADWFNNIKSGTLVCIQSSSITDPEYPWYIRNPSPNIESFKQKYNLSDTFFCDTLRIQYDTWGYDRFMLIGVK